MYGIYRTKAQGHNKATQGLSAKVAKVLSDHRDRSLKLMYSW